MYQEYLLRTNRQNHTLYSVEIIFGLILSVRTKLGVNTDTLGEPGVARLSKEVRFGPGETSSSSKCSRRAVVGFIIGHSFVQERKSKFERVWGSWTSWDWLDYKQIDLALLSWHHMRARAGLGLFWVRKRNCQTFLGTTQRSVRAGPVQTLRKTVPTFVFWLARSRVGVTHG